MKDTVRLIGNARPSPAPSKLARERNEKGPAPSTQKQISHPDTYCGIRLLWGNGGVSIIAVIQRLFGGDTPRETSKSGRGIERPFGHYRGQISTLLKTPERTPLKGASIAEVGWLNITPIPYETTA